jgi:hypothetical protein
MSETKLAAGAAIAVTAFIAGYLFGGWVSAVGGGTEVWGAIERWQTLAAGVIAVPLGLLAWRGIHATIAASHADTDRQLAEMRRQFRHEMSVTTARERTEIANRALGPIYDCRVIWQQAEAGARLGSQSSSAATARRRSNMRSHAEKLNEWLRSDDARPVTSLLGVVELGDLNILVDMVNSYTDPSDPSVLELNESRFDFLALLAKTAEARLRGAVAMAESWVPPE